MCAADGCGSPRALWTAHTSMPVLRGPGPGHTEFRGGDMSWLPTRAVGGPGPARALRTGARPGLRTLPARILGECQTWKPRGRGRLPGDFTLPGDSGHLGERPAGQLPRVGLRQAGFANAAQTRAVVISDPQPRARSGRQRGEVSAEGLAGGARAGAQVYAGHSRDGAGRPTSGC